MAVALVFSALAVAREVVYQANPLGPGATASNGSNSQQWFNSGYAPNGNYAIGIYQIYAANGAKTRIVNGSGYVEVSVPNNPIYTSAWCWNRYAPGGPQFYAVCRYVNTVPN